MKSLGNQILICSLIGMILFTGCAKDATGHLTGGLTPTGQAAINNTAKGILTLAQVYQAVGEPGLPASDQALYKNYLNAGGYLVQSYVGQQLPASAVNTGSPAVDQAIVASIVPGANVTQADANTVYAAAALKPSTTVPVPTSRNSTHMFYRIADGSSWHTCVAVNAAPIPNGGTLSEPDWR